MHLLLTGLGAFILTYLGVAAVRAISMHFNVLDIPNERSLHVIPTPRGGGLAIVIVTLICCGVVWYLDPLRPIHGLGNILVGGVLVAGISYWDDLQSLPIWIRFTVHLAVAGLIVMGVGYWRIMEIPFFGVLDLGWMGLPLTFLWIVGMINAYNFMDGIDGIAGGQCIVAGLGWAVLGGISGQSLIAGTGGILAASCLGFLGDNRPPARIFMGDVGSAFLGYTFAVLPLIVSQDDSRLAFAGVLLVWPFIFDTLFTFLRRLIHRENVFTAHSSHFYQRLVATGYPHKKVASLYIVLSTIGLVCSTVLVIKGHWADYMTVIIIGITALILWLGTRWRERSVSKATSSQ